MLIRYSGPKNNQPRSHGGKPVDEVKRRKTRWTSRGGDCDPVCTLGSNNRRCSFGRRFGDDQEFLTSGLSKGGERGARETCKLPKLAPSPVSADQLIRPARVRED